jgi:competence protein ComEC
MEEGMAVKVSSSYSILQNKFERIIVYTDEPLHYDSVYRIIGKKQKIKRENGFFRFDYAEWAASQGVKYTVGSDQISIIRDTVSFRGLLQDQIERRTDTETVELMEKILLNISPSKDNADRWFYSNGFSYAGVLGMIEIILRQFMDRNKRSYVMAGICLVMNLLYGFPLLLAESLMFRILKLKNMDRFEVTGLGLAGAMLLYPSQIFSVTFLIPAVYRICGCISPRDKACTFTAVLIIQSVLFQSMNPVQNLLYPFLQKFYGLLYLYFLAVLLCGSNPSIPLLIDQASALIDTLDLSGSVLGSGTLFFLMIVFSMRRSKNFSKLALSALLLFQMCGLFHPFAEIIFINVGQGDSILVRMPMNSENILIDTGKPSQYSAVQSMLDGLGIQHLDGLIITHGDNDHSGNAESIRRDYNVKKYIDTHQQKSEFNSLIVYDLNERVNAEDENTASITNYFALNGMKILLMGDDDQAAENEIAEKYAELKADVLKLSHHGSKTGSSDMFLNTVQPGIGIISSGSYSIYHHPSKETIQKLLQRHIPYFDTKEEGDMCILCLPFGNVFFSSNGSISIIE